MRTIAPMNSSRILIALLAASALVRVADAQPFVRLIDSYYHLNNDKYSKINGFGIAAGSMLGDQGTHELSLEWDRAKWSYLEQPSPGIYGGTSVYGSGTIQPVLFNYRFRFGDDNSRIRFYLGPSVGLTLTHGNLTSSNSSSIYYSGGYKAWSVTYGGGAGIQLRIVRDVWLDAGYQYVWIEGVDASLPYHSAVGGTGSPLTLNLGDLKATVLRLSLQIAF